MLLGGVVPSSVSIVDGWILLAYFIVWLITPGLYMWATYLAAKKKQNGWLSIFLIVMFLGVTSSVWSSLLGLNTLLSNSILILIFPVTLIPLIPAVYVYRVLKTSKQSKSVDNRSDSR